VQQHKTAAPDTPGQQMHNQGFQVLVGACVSLSVLAPLAANKLGLW
jgi:hypothetical protein